MLRSSLLIFAQLHLLVCVFNPLLGNTFRISGGSGVAPFYQFTNENGEIPDFSTLKLIPGQTYKFTSNGISADHPFMIGETYGDMNSTFVTGGPLTGTSGEIVVTIPIGYSGDLYYFCNAHATMVQAFQISDYNSFTLTDGFSYIFLENQHYKVTNPDHQLFISDLVGSNTILNEVFPARYVTSDEYLLFHSIHNSPRQYHYFDPNNLEFNGTIDLIPYLEQGPIVSDQLSSEDYFGYNLVINDWNETIVSAPSKNSNNGEIYVFELNSNNQLVQKSVLQPEVADQGWWGASLEVSGDMLFIGAPNALSNQGKVLVYKRINGNYARQGEIADPLTAVTHFFGTSISVEPIHNKLVIAPNVEGSDRAGRVEVFDMDTSQNWNHSQTLWSDDNVSGNYFGISHAVTDDFLIVGAPLENNRYGRAYIFNREDNGSWSNNPVVITPTLGSRDEFGSTVQVMDDFAFVGAKLGDGNVTDSGAVYIFQNELGSWNEKAKLIPPIGDGLQTFSHGLEVLDDLLIVSSIGVGSGGMAYIYKMHDENASDWRLISALDNNDSTTHSTRQFLPIASNKGMIAIGSPEDSQNLVEGGSFKVFLNQGWQEGSALQLDPLFTTQAASQLGTIIEDSATGISYLFSVEHPFESNFTFNITSANTPIENYSISADGNFSYIPEGNFSGIKSFSLEVNSLRGSLEHNFTVEVTEQPDAPIFESNQSLTLDPVWIGENTQQTIHVFDADGDALILTSSSLPEGLSISGLQISGTITNDAILNNQSSKDFPIDITVSDGTGTQNATKTFNLRVYSRNSAPYFVNENGEVITSINTILDEDFDALNWFQSLGVLQFRDDYTQSGFLLSMGTHPSNGTVTLDPTSNSSPILYLPDSDYFGNDSFSVILHDTNNPSKSFELPFTILINAVNDPPVLLSMTQLNANEGIPFSYYIQWTDIDNDSGHLVSVDNLPSWISYDEASLSLNGTPQWGDYQEDAYEIIISIEDPNGLTTNSVLEVTVIPQNYPPRFDLENLSLSLNEDTSIELPISSRDDDINDGLINWHILTTPSHGTYSLATDDYVGTLRYQPDGNFTGQDFIEIKIVDPLNPHLYDNLEINISVLSVEDAPVINPSAIYTDAVVGYEWEFEFFGRDGDIGQEVTLIQPLLPSWLTFTNNIDGNSSRAKISGIPSASDVGQLTISLSTIDTTGLEGGQSFEVSVITENIVPEILQGDTLNVELSEDGFWEKQTPLTCQDANKQKLEWSIIENATNGSVEILFDDEILEFIKYIPDQNFNGFDSAVIQVSDGIDFDRFTFIFKVISVDDVPTFHSNQNGQLLRIEDGEKFSEKITFSDGDGDLANFQISGIPSWVVVDSSKFTDGELSLSGVPEVVDEGLHDVSITITDQKNLSSTISFEIEAYVNNYPPVLIFSEKQLELDEDQSKVKLGVLSVTDIDQATGHTWFISDYPKSGTAMLTLDGQNRILYYLPDGNFSGKDEFTFVVGDSGTELGAPKYHFERVEVQVNPIPDLPIFTSSPPLEAYAGEEFIYNVQTKDGDLPHDKVKIELVTGPPWLAFVDNEDGSGQLRGIGSYKNEGISRISFRVEDSEGNFDLQTFLLELIVLDYPPVFKSVSTGTILENVTLYTNEDQSLEGWIHPKGFYAINPDPENDDFKDIKWSLHKGSSSGSTLEVGGSGNRPPTFRYNPPHNFNGKDSFTLLMNEGDLVSELAFEIYINPVADPPYFLTDLQPLYVVDQGQPFELQIKVEDIDSSEIQFRLLAPSWEKKPWLRIDDYGTDGVVTLKGVPKINPNGKLYPYTLVAVDESGLKVSKGLSIEVRGVNSPPSIIPDEIEILFDQEGNPISDFGSLIAYDPDDDSLVWSIREDEGPLWGDAFVEGNGSLPKKLNYLPQALEANADRFRLEVSDGLGSDSVLVLPVISWGEGISVVGEIEDFKIKEKQGFWREIGFYPGNSVDQIELSLLEGPSWIEIYEIKKNEYSISGVAPTGSSGIYNVVMEVKGVVTKAFKSEFAITVDSSSPPTLTIVGDDVVRLSKLEPVVNLSANAYDSHGSDISDAIAVSTLQDFNALGYKILEYSVRDKYENTNSKELLLRQYAECPLQLTETRLKFSGRNPMISWSSNGEIDVTANQFKILEENGVLIDRSSHDGSTRFSFSRNLENLDSYGFKGDKIVVSDSLSSAQGTFVVGQFSRNLNLGFSSVISDYKNNVFIASFNPLDELLWVKSFGSSEQIESLSLVQKDDESLVLSGIFSKDLNYKGVSPLKFTAQPRGIFICEFHKDGRLNKSKVIEIENSLVLGGCKTYGGELILFFNNLNNLKGNILVLNSQLETKNKIHFDSTEYLHISDLEIAKGFCIVGGAFQGNIEIDNQPLLSSPKRSSFVLSHDLSKRLVWAKLFPSTEHSELQEIEVDYWGDLILGMSFYGELETGIGKLSSLGEEDLVVLNCKLINSNTLWYKRIGGLGKEKFHSLKTSNLGTPLVSFETSNGVFIDGLEFSETREEEIHLALLTSRAGVPKIERDEIVITELGSFSQDLQLVHPEYLFFQKVSGPDWIDIVSKDGNLGHAVLVGDTGHLTHNDLLGEPTLRIRAFTMDGSFDEKDLKISFPQTEEFNLSLGKLPEANVGFDFLFKDGNEVNKILINPEGGWNLVGRFPDLDVSRPAEANNFNQLISLSEDMQLSNLCSIYCTGKIHTSDVIKTEKGSFCLYGTFNGILTCQNVEMSSNEGKDIFLIEVSSTGNVINFSKFGSSFDEMAKELLSVNEIGLIFCGSFENETKFGDKVLKSKGQSDGFICCLDANDFSKVKWVKNYGNSGLDQITFLNNASEGKIISGSISNSISIGESSNLSFTPKSKLDLFLIDCGSGDLDASNSIFSSGRIDNAKLATENLSEGISILALEFEGTLAWGGGITASSGGFDIITMSVGKELEMSKGFHQIGGGWNDRLTDLDILGNHYYLTSYFYQNTILNSELISSKGSSDAILAKVNLGTHEIVDYYILSSTVADEITSMIPVSDEFIVYAGVSASQNANNSNYFFDSLGTQSKNPKLLSSVPFGIPISSPFSFTLKTGPWGAPVSDIELIEFEEENGYKWLQANLDRNGNINFSGISPSLDVTVPFDFRVHSSASSESLEIKFDLNFLKAGFNKPVVEFDREIEMFSGETHRSQIKFYDEDHENISLSIQAPDWINLSEVSTDNAVIVIDSGENVGLHEFTISATDESGFTSTYEVNVSILSKDQSTQHILKIEDPSTDDLSWIAERIDLGNGWSFHLDFGWIYIEESEDGSAWLWKENWGWLWSKYDLWQTDGAGHFYNHSNSNWLFWDPANQMIFDFEEDKWSRF